MNNDTLYKNYLRDGTAGNAVIRKFYFRYADILSYISIADMNDVVHEVFVSLSKTDFKSVQNTEHYIHRAIKLCCWSMLDKAVRLKTTRSSMTQIDEKEKDIQSIDSTHSSSDNQIAELEGIELLGQVNLFKAQLDARGMQLLNLLIDNANRSEIAHLLDMNMNTLDTNIRRLRIQLADFLKRQGYTYAALERFSGG